MEEKLKELEARIYALEHPVIVEILYPNYTVEDNEVVKSLELIGEYTVD